jgi:PAS domain S-box-containing protein
MRQRLVWPNAVVIVLLLVIGSIAMLHIWRLTSAVEDLLVARERAVITQEVHHDCTALTTLAHSLLIVEDASAFESEFAAALDALQVSHERLTAAIQTVEEEEPFYPFMIGVSDSIDNVVQVSEAMLRQIEVGHWVQARMYMTMLVRNQEQLEQETNKMVELATAMEDVAAEQVSALRWIVFVYPSLIALSLLVGTILTLRTTRSIARPVEQMTEGAMHLAAGALDKRVSIDSTDELGQLATAFNRMADRLQASYLELERRVAERTADLERRAVQLQTAAEVARDAAASWDLDDLLNRAVNLVRERFGFYHASIFLVDEWGEYAVLRAATGEEQSSTLECGHRLQVGGAGLVGFVTATGQPYVSLNRETTRGHPANPTLPQTRSELALPLKVGKRIIGALDVQSRRPEAFDENDVMVLYIMADQLAMAIENVRLLHQMGQTMRELAQERNLLEATLNALPDLLLEMDGQGRILGYRASHPELLHLSPEGFLGQAVDQVLPEEAASVIQRALSKASKLGRSTGAVYPFQTARGTIWIELSVAAQSDHDSENARFIALVRDVTTRVQAEEALRKRNEELAALNQAGRALTSILDLDQVLATFLEEVRHLMGAVASSVWLLDPPTEQLVCLHATGANSERVRGWRLKPEQGIAGWVVRHGETLNIPDALADERHFQGVDLETGLAVRSILSVPLQSKQEVIGVLQVVDTAVDRFSTTDETLLELLAGSAAIAIDNARLVETLRRHTLELEARNEELDAFAHTVAHDLKNPLGSMVGFAEVLEEEYASLPEDELKRYLQLISQGGRKMANIIDELLLLAGVRKTEARRELLDMGAIVGDAQGRLAYMADEYEAEIYLPDTWLPAVGYSPWIEEVWVNYLSNAIKYGGRPPRVELGSASTENGEVRFWIRDNGPGITLEEQRRIFTPFTQLGQVRARGHGLGLSIVRRIVEKLDGRMGVESDPDRGSEFWFTLPAAKDGHRTEDSS